MWMGRSHLMFTDFDVDFTFAPSDERIVITGAPHWMAVSGVGASARVDRRFQDAETTLAANPAVFASGFRLARYAAIFRYLETDCLGQWQDNVHAHDAESGSLYRSGPTHGALVS